MLWLPRARTTLRKDDWSRWFPDSTRQSLQLKSASVDELLEYKKIAVWIPGPVGETELFLKRLQRQNKDMVALGLWEGLERTEIRVKKINLFGKLAIDKQTYSFINTDEKIFNTNII